jgi:hypothetical protein
MKFFKTSILELFDSSQKTYEIPVYREYIPLVSGSQLSGVVCQLRKIIERRYSRGGFLGQSVCHS